MNNMTPQVTSWPLQQHNREPTKTVCLVVRVWYPNHQALFERLSAKLNERGVTLRYLLLGAFERNRPWETFEGVVSVKPEIIKGIQFRLFDREFFVNRDVVKKLSEIDPNLIVLSPWSERGIFEAKRWAKENDRRCIGWVMGPRQACFGPLSILRGFFSRMLIRNFLSMLDLVFCYGDGVIDAMRKINRDENLRFVNVRHTVDERLFCNPSLICRRTKRKSFRESHKISESKFVFGYVGQLIPRKGVGDLLDACTRLSDKGIDFELHILGAGPLQTIVHDSILVRHSKVKLLSRLGSSELIYFFSSVDCMIVPSHFDDWCTVVNESFFARTPIICSTGAYASFDLIEDGVTGLKYNAGDVDELVSKMRFAFDNRNQIDSYAECAFARISDWKVENSAEIWSREICALL